MIKKRILVFDDEKVQAESLSLALSKKMEGYLFKPVFEEDSMLSSIENEYFSLAIVDLRMDKYKLDGVQLIKHIIEINPFSKIIIISAYLKDFNREMQSLLMTGKIAGVFEKESMKDFVPKLRDSISDYYSTLESKDNEINKALLSHYSDLKNENDTFTKGMKFENFISLLFGSIGYQDISKRVIDKSRNEVDLVIRNEIDDSFLNKFGKYILIECKNKPVDGVGKNDFIQFYSKVENSNGFAELGILATSGYIAKTTYIEAIRSSKGKSKIIFLSNPEIIEILHSTNKLEAFKKIIDTQVKDN